MKRSIKHLATLLFFLSTLAYGTTQSDNHRKTIITELLSFPAPPPPPGFPTKEPANGNRLQQPYPPPPPGESAPLEVFARYWADSYGLKPEDMSEQTRERLLKACEAHPQWLSRVLDRLPDTPAAHDRIKAILDGEQRSPSLDEDWQKKLSGT